MKLSRTAALCAGGCAILLGAARASAHGFVGSRFFPPTISTDDPFAVDELALPTVSWIRQPGEDGGSPGYVWVVRKFPGHQMLRAARTTLRSVKPVTFAERVERAQALDRPVSALSDLVVHALPPGRAIHRFYQVRPAGWR